MLARDRMGIKPLYYYRSGDELYFGSELKAILEHPDKFRGSWIWRRWTGIFR